MQPQNATQQKAPNLTTSPASRRPNIAPNTGTTSGGIRRNGAQNHSVHNNLKQTNETQENQRRVLRKKRKKTQEPPPRRRNDESYVFSRSLSETRERILTERRERLEDARQFQKEDVNQKLRIGIISFLVTSVLILSTVAIIITSSLSTSKIKKSKGEYIYHIGQSTSEAAYSDTIRDGMFYVSMNSVAELCELTLSGSSATGLRFTAKNGDWISFTKNSSEAKINGYGMPMPAPAHIEDSDCSVPLDFLEYVLSGITVKVDLEKKEIIIRRLEEVDSTALEPHYVPVGFALRIDVSLFPLDENKYFKDKPVFSFKNDLTEYEQYMNPETPENYMALINKQNPTPSMDYEPETLIYISGETRGYYLDAVAAKALEAMLKEMYSEGFNDIYVTSGYRSYNRQKTLYENYIKSEKEKNPALTDEQATQLASFYSAPPGMSEHHTGLAVDLMSTKMYELDESFAENEAYDWLLANAWKFGFILRYPEGKSDITGYVFEPWHWRFVGRATALEVLKSGLCFEEYLEMTAAQN